MSTEIKKCAHPACNCQVPEGQSYCSESCKSAGEMLEISCNCEHEACRSL